MMILTTTVGDVYTYSASAVGRKGYGRGGPMHAYEQKQSVRGNKTGS